MTNPRTHWTKSTIGLCLIMALASISWAGKPASSSTSKPTVSARPAAPAVTVVRPARPPSTGTSYQVVPRRKPSQTGAIVTTRPSAGSRPTTVYTSPGSKPSTVYTSPGPATTVYGASRVRGRRVVSPIAAGRPTGKPTVGAAVPSYVKRPRLCPSNRPSAWGKPAAAPGVQVDKPSVHPGAAPGFAVDKPSAHPNYPPGAWNPGTGHRPIRRPSWESPYFHYVAGRYWSDCGAWPGTVVFYAPHLYSSGYYSWHTGSRSTARYRSVRCSPYRYRSYCVYPWYNTYYYSISIHWDDALYFAPGFAWGFTYASSSGWDVYFSYGYGGGVRLGDCPWVYSWYPYGGHQRVRAGDSVPYDYTRYVALED